MGEQLRHPSVRSPQFESETFPQQVNSNAIPRAMKVTATFSLALIGSALTSCAVPQRNENPPISAKSFANGTWYPSKGQSEPTGDALRALNATKKHEAQISRREAVDYHYSISKAATGFDVQVHFGYGFSNGTPIMKPGGHCTYRVASDFNTVTILPGS